MREGRHGLSSCELCSGEHRRGLRCPLSLVVVFPCGQSNTRVGRIVCICVIVCYRVDMSKTRKGKGMKYPVRTVYYFDQLVEADTAEEAMLKGEDTQPSELETERLGLYEVDRKAEAQPVA